MFAQQITVVAPKNNDRVVGELESIQRVEEFANLRIHEADSRKVTPHGLALLRLVQIPIRRFGIERGRRNVVEIVRRAFG